MPPRQKQVKTTLCSGKGKGNKQSTAATTAASLKRSDVDVESVISDTNTIDHQDISDVDDASSSSTTSSSKKLRVSKEVIDPPTEHIWLHTEEILEVLGMLQLQLSHEIFILAE
jgi:hypothetical protein